VNILDLISETLTFPESFQIDITSALLKRRGAHAITMKKRGKVGYEIRVVTIVSGPVYLLKLKL
jgi:hypothetical protein